MGVPRPIAILSVLVLGATGCQHTPPPYVSPIDGGGSARASAEAPPPTESGAPIGTLGTSLQSEIRDALKAVDWPNLDPSMDAVITGLPAAAEVRACGSPNVVPGNDCTWGAADAPVRIVLVGDSIALSYANPLRLVALNSNGQIQVHSEALPGCQFADELIDNPDESIKDACPGRKQHAVDYINSAKPTAVIVSNSYGEKRIGARQITPKDWSDSVQRLLAKLTASGKVVMLSAPPADVNIADCYARRGAKPADCISRVQNQWGTVADAEQGIAQAVGGVWVDSRPWLCFEQMCPAFVGVTPTKFDAAHISPAYGEKISPVIAESLRIAGIVP